MADSQAIICPVSTSSTPSISSSATALAANSARTAFIIQNVGTNALFVRFGSGASTTVFNFVLKAGTQNSDGNGGIFTSGDIVYTGLVSIDGTSPLYVATELTK